jgi:hypothetical protein
MNQPMMKTFSTLLCALFVAFSAAPVKAQGTIPIALAQSVDVNGRPLAGCLLYIYQTGTVATPQQAFSDTGLTLPLPNPMVCDQNGRLPMFYLANGSVHPRLTDANGLVQFDYPSMLVVGPSSGGGGGGMVDPTTIASTGDIKFRATGEVLTGWVRMNAQTIGSATSGASGRANADTQNLFVYLWNNCPNTHCSVSTGRGASGLADFNANKTITLLDWRSRTPVGLDDMGNSAAGRLQASNITSGGGDGTTTPNATGGETNHTLVTAEVPVITPSGTVVDNSHTHSYHDLTTFSGYASGGGLGAVTGYAGTSGQTTGSTTETSTFNGASFGGGSSHNVMNPFLLGTWYIKL